MHPDVTRTKSISAIKENYICSQIVRSWKNSSLFSKITLPVLIISILLYIALTLTPSHYSIGLKILGVDSNPLLGKARPVRSDDWIVMTPLFQIAVNGHFSTTNLISPYQETLKGFYALPILDWSLIFKPQLWSFWVLPPHYAYSTYFAILWSSFLIGYTTLLRQLGATTVLAVAGAIILFSSHLVQVWWTTNAPTFAFAPLPLIAFLLPIRAIYKAILIFYSACVWIFSLVYPPFIIPAAFAMVFLVLAFRPNMLTLKNITVGIVAAGLTVVILYAYFGDLINLMMQTVYPGQRQSSGGGLENSKLLANILPFFTSNQFDPYLGNSNACEIAVVSTILPLSIIIFTEYRTLKQSLNKSHLWIGLGLLAMLCWMVLPIPSQFGAIFQWNRVPASRMTWGFGFLFIISLIVIMSKINIIFSPTRIYLFSSALIAAWLVSKIGFSEAFGNYHLNAWQSLKRSWFDWIGIIPFSILGIIVYRWPNLITSRHAVVTASAITGIITFGTFNPYQRAVLFFDIPSTAFLQSAEKLAHDNPNGWAVLPGHYGALINGAGIPAINHVLTSPQPEFWAKAFPNIESHKRHQIFSRFAHIIPTDEPMPSANNDVIFVPTSAFQREIK